MSKKFQVCATRYFLEECYIEIDLDAENEDEAREVVAEMLGTGEADNWDWTQMGVEDERIDTVKEL